MRNSQRPPGGEDDEAGLMLESFASVKNGSNPKNGHQHEEGWLQK